MSELIEDSKQGRRWDEGPEDHRRRMNNLNRKQGIINGNMPTAVRYTELLQMMWKEAKVVKVAGADGP